MRNQVVQSVIHRKISGFVSYVALLDVAGMLELF